MNNSIHIRAPEQLQFRNPEAILDVGELQKWLQTLPILKPIPTIRKLLDAVNAINLQEINDNKRFKLLAEYRKLISQIFPSLNQDALKRLSIREAEQNQIQNHTTRLCIAISEGYRIILKKALQKNMTLKGEHFLSLYYAAEMLSLALLNGYRAYKSAPQNLHYDLHQIYLLAETNQMLDHDIEDSTLNLAASNIATLYRQIMVLAFLDPFRMPPGVAEKLFHKLAYTAEHCSILSRVPDPDSVEIFVVDLTTDEAPRPVFKLSSHKNLKVPRVFDTRPLSNKVRADITVLAGENHTLAQQAEIDLLQRLIPPDKNSLTRKSERSASDRSCKLTFGIDAVYHFLGLDKDEFNAVTQSDADSFSSHPIESWSVTNESETGLSLTSTVETRLDIRVGDIIGLLTESNHDNSSQGKIAIIRWIKDNQQSQVQIGVELIMGNIMPAMCRLIDHNGEATLSPGIFISSIKQTNTPATLLTPKKVYQRGRAMEVTIGDQPMRIEAGFLRDDTFTFDRFDFTSLS